jgi:hypothetical protein
MEEVVRQGNSNLLGVMSIGKSLVYVVFILLCVPVLLFWLHFRTFNLSNSTSDWETFAVYFGGTVGTLASIVGGYLLFVTLNAQRRQGNEQTFFNYLNVFTNKENSIRSNLIGIEITLHQNAKILAETPGVLEAVILESYVNQLKSFFIADYSINTKSPRLKVALNGYFKFIDSLCLILNDSNFEKSQFEQLRRFFLSQLHDGEIKMICYYYYLFFDIVNSSDALFSSENVVVKSRIFEGALFFSDDFSRNYDPRIGHFDVPIGQYKDQVSGKRTDG